MSRVLSPLRTVAVAGFCLSVGLTLAGCGSQLEPQTVAQVNGTSPGGAGGAIPDGDGRWHRHRRGGARCRGARIDRRRWLDRDRRFRRWRILGRWRRLVGRQGSQGHRRQRAGGHHQGRQLRRVQELDRDHRQDHQDRQRLRHLRPGAGHLRVRAAGDPRVRRLLQLHRRHLRSQAGRAAARQSRRRRRRPAGLHQGLRRGVRCRRFDVGLRLRWRRDRPVVRPARHPVHDHEPRTA